MDINDIKSFISRFKKNDGKMSFDKIFATDADKIIRFTYATNDSDVLDNHLDVLSEFSEIVDIKTSQLIGDRNLHKTNVILDTFESAIRSLFSAEKLNVEKFLNFEIKHIYSLSESGFISDAINNALFLNHRIKNKIKRLENRNRKRFVHLCLRKLYAFMRHKCLQHNFHKYSYKFHFMCKTKDLILLTHFYKVSSDDNELLLPSQIIRLGKFSHYLKMGGTLSEKKGIKKIAYLITLPFSILSNIISRYFWGYGDKIFYVVVNSILIISIYAISIYLGLIKVTQNGHNGIDLGSSYYFSIVTFTSLGYGDIRPCDHIFSRIAMSIEAILGLLCISLIIFILGKRTRI